MFVMRVDQSTQPNNNYPEFSEILEFSNLIEKLLNEAEMTEEAHYPILEIQSLFWRILWLTYPNHCYKQLFKMKNSEQDLTSHISACINELRRMDEFELFYFEFPFDFKHLMNTLQSLTDREISKKIEKLFERYKLFDIGHFRHQINVINSLSKRLLNDMKQLLYNEVYLSRLKLDTQNKFTYYCNVIENYSHLVSAEIMKRNRVDEKITADKIAEKSVQILAKFKEEASKMGYEEIIFDIELAISMIHEIDDTSEPFVREIELKDLHLEDSETIAAVERTMDTLSIIEDQSMMEEYFDSVFPLINEAVEEEDDLEELLYDWDEFDPEDEE